MSTYFDWPGFQGRTSFLGTDNYVIERQLSGVAEDYTIRVDFVDELISSASFIKYADKNNAYIIKNPDKCIDFAIQYSALLK